MYEFITNKIAELGIENCRVEKNDVFRFLENCNEKFDIIFAGPPYALKNIDDIPCIIRGKKLLKRGGWFILEHTPANNYESEPLFKTMRNYGTTVFSFFINQ
jgi:16S rRNA G966 N2-methylase RsmD